jgi:L1 cell adhesion molecule like protein
VSLVTVNGGIFMVKATAGAALGGDDFDDCMVDYYIQEFKRRHNKDFSRCPQALRRLRMATSELARRTLSSTIQIDSLYEGMDFYTTLTRGRFNEQNKGLFSKCMETVEKCLRSSGSVTLLFPWNTTLPAAVRKLNVFTDFENQPEILLPVYEGEGLLTEDNVLLGEIQLSGFSPGPPGTQITVSFDIDMNGILNVSAEDMKQNKISAVVRNKARLSKQEINKMVQEAAAEYQNKLGCNNVLEGYVLI